MLLPPPDNNESCDQKMWNATGPSLCENEGLQPYINHFAPAGLPAGKQ